MHVDEIWAEKIDAGDEDICSGDAIRLLKYLDNDEWLVEFGTWDTDDMVFTSERDFLTEFPASAWSDEDAVEEFNDEEFEDIITGSEIFKDYVKVQ